MKKFGLYMFAAFACQASMLSGRVSSTTGRAPAIADVRVCEACHGASGVSGSNIIPILAGQKADYLREQLIAFKQKRRVNSFMTPIATQLSDREIAFLSQYWSSKRGAASLLPQSRTRRSPPEVPWRVTFPRNFPVGYSMYESIENPKSRSIADYYANQPAIRAVRSGQPLPPGSEFVIVGYRGVPKADGGMTTGAVEVYAVQESRIGWGDLVPGLMKNGNWNYATFNGNRVRHDEENQALCFACHLSVSADDYVFTMNALRKFVGRVGTKTSRYGN